MPYCESLLPHLFFVSCPLALYPVFCFAVIRYALMTGEISCSWVSSVQFSHSVMSKSLWPHGLQHSRLSCESPTTGTCSNSCSSSQMNRVYFILCHPSPPHFLPFFSMGKQWKQWQNLFSLAPKSLRMVTVAMKLKDACSLEGRLWQTMTNCVLKSRDITLPTKVHLSNLWFFQWSGMDVRVGLWRRLSAEKLMLLNCGVGEDSLESFGLQGDPISPS